MDTLEVEQLYRRYFPLIRAKCRRMLRDSGEAEDVAQETFVRLWKSDLSHQAPAAIVAWVYRTSTRLAIDRLRHRKVVLAFEPTVQVRHPDGVLEARQLLDRVAKVASEEELQAAILCRVDGLDQRRAGELLGCSERTVRRLLAAFDSRVARIEEAPA